MPYFINIRKYSNEQAYAAIKEWADNMCGWTPSIWTLWGDTVNQHSLQVGISLLQNLSENNQVMPDDWQAVKNIMSDD